MNKQPEAMRLADALERGTYLLYIERDNTATELRRLHEVNQELLEALKTVLAYAPEPYCAITRTVDAQVRAAIKKATGESK